MKLAGLIFGSLALLLLAAACAEGLESTPTRPPLRPAGGTDSDVVVEPGVTIVVAADEADETPSGCDVSITTPGDDLRYDIDFMSVKAGCDVVLRYVNNATAFQHNWVLAKAGTKDEVAADGGLLQENGFVPPDDDRVLAATIPLVEPGETRELRFSAPPVGKYDFVCTFPGHNATKFGVFEVKP